MAKIEFFKEDLTIEVEEGTLLLDAIRQAGLDIETPCNGMGFCGKCKVIAKGALSKAEGRELKSIDLIRNERLSCVATVEGEVLVELIEKEKVLQTVSKGYSIEVPLDSQVKRVKLREIQRKSPEPYGSSTGYTLRTVELLQKLTEFEENHFKNIWGVVAGDELLDVANYEKNILGLAVDIGTTGVSYYLVDLETGGIVGSLSSLNPQTRFGGDVLTRISYCMEHPEGAEEMKKLIVDEINRSMDRIVGDHYQTDEIFQIVISANTTMMHLFLGVNPTALAKSPYRSIFLSVEPMKAFRAGLNVNPAAILDIMPSASSYVGGDITSGLLASGFLENSRAAFIDIGTNGELAAIVDGQVICTSTAAGPALEGMNIECGCRAEPGAIEKFDIDEDFKVTYQTIENRKATGICGSGLIDIVGALVRRGLLDKGGRWSRKIDPRVAERLKDKKFYITDEIYISQKDIRQVQLAKGAIAAGLILMLEEIGATMEDIPEVYIAGAFGYHIDPDNIRTIGLIPGKYKGEIKFLGNTSLEGARLSLINRGIREDVRRVRESMEVVELSLRDNFQKVFLKELNF